MGILVNGKLNVSQQFALAAKRPTVPWGASSTAIYSSRALIIFITVRCLTRMLSSINYLQC